MLVFLFAGVSIVRQTHYSWILRSTNISLACDENSNSVIGQISHAPGDPNM